MVLKSRLLTTAFIVPFTVAATLAPARGFELKPDTDETDFPTYTTTVATSDDEPDGDGILIDGSPPDDNAGLLIDSENVVIIDGPITIRSRQDNGDASATPLTAATGVKITANNSSVRFKSGARIYIIEGISLTDSSADLRGPSYDADGDGFADNDSDQDGISEGSHALPGNNWRVGFWKVGEVSADIIGEAGSSIVVYGNGVGTQHAAGVVISDTLLDGYLDLSTRITMFGDETRGVDILSSITGYYRQRGDVDVRGENGIGIDIGAAISGALMIEGGVNATGYSTAPTPLRGVDESGLTAEQRTANDNERRRGASAVNIAGDINGGVIIGGLVNRFRSDAETTASTAILDARNDETVGNVAALATLPYQFDGNRELGRITTYGEAAGEATLKISSTIGAGSGGTSRGSVETLLDTLNDDEDANTDAYAGTAYGGGLKQFFYSHGLMNRGAIEANGWYDGFKADALLLDGGTIHGGIYNSGTISATAFNENAQALIIGTGATLDAGLRTDNSVLLNGGTISALTQSHSGSSYFDENAIYKATAITLAQGAILPDDANFINRSDVLSIAPHTKTAADEDDAANEAIAFDFAAYTGNINVRQEMRQNDLLLDASAPNANTNPYLGGGDLDIDRNGDGAIDTRDVPAPRIIGDVKFHPGDDDFTEGDNDFTLNAGTVNGNISFGGGSDTLTLANEIADDTEDNYTAPITSVTGSIAKLSGTDLDITIGARTQLHLVGQEAEAEVLAIDELTVSGELKITVDDEQLTADTSVMDVTTLTVNNGAKIIPNLTGLITAEATTIKLIDYTDEGVTLPSDVLPTGADSESAFIYNVTLSHDEDANAISVTFARKTAADLGLNQTEAASFDAVLTHFSDNENLESAFTGINGVDAFKAAYRQLLPHYSDGTAQQLSGLADMATGAVSQHLQIANAGGRRGGDGWLQQFGDYRKQDSSANGQTVSGNNYAISLGYDLPVYAIDALGLYMQMGFSSVNEKSADINEVKSESISYGAYLADTIGPLRYQLNGSYGFVDLESERLINFNGVVDISRADWEATSTAASARLAFPILDTNHLLRLEAGVDYFRLEHDNYAERESVGNGFAMQVRGGESEKTSQFIGLRGGYRAEEGGDGVGIIFEPNYYLGWRTSDDFTPYSATANFVGTPGETFRLESHIEPEDALDVGLGFAAHNDYFAFEFNYRARIADDEETHGGGVSIRLLF
ncbi:autotransporter outer membrane beta-barrel domain-containing protein [Alphaproteobacteria bacterium]|nr:autotransporter outer membrane beta-barrel domain-containing protein [Alphaproteobacteria bacterium]